MTSTKRSSKSRNKARAKIVLSQVFDIDMVPDVVTISQYLSAIEMKICQDNGLSDAVLSEEWLQLFIDFLDAESNENIPAVEREFELHKLGEAQKHANERYQNILIEI